VTHASVTPALPRSAGCARTKKRMCACRLRVTRVCHTYYVRVACVLQCGAVWCSVYPRTCAKFTQDSLSYQKRHTCGSERVKGYAEYFFATPMPKPPGGPGGPWGALGDPGGPTHLPQTSCEKTLFSDFGAKIQIYGAKFKYLASKHVAPQLK